MATVQIDTFAQPCMIGGSSVMTLDPTWLFLQLIPGGIGFVLFTYGKKQERWLYMAGGVLFMAYPYFATTVTLLIVVGVAIGCGLWFAVRLGW
jgi:hypothetical protein